LKIIFSFFRICFIFLVWTFGYCFWLQRVMLHFWRFNPLAKSHWEIIWERWQNGWVIQTADEWMFASILFFAVPVWLTGGSVLCAIPWLKWIKVLVTFPFKLLFNHLKNKKKEKNTARPKITRKKSYKQTRPPAIRAGSGKIKHPEKAPEKEEAAPASPAPASATQAFSASAMPSHSHETPSSTMYAASSSGSGGSVMDVLRSAGYRLISDAKISGKKIDFVAVAANHLLLCLVDSEAGDWLADEERFNNEEPLWFSESNHRISPVRVVLNARDALAPMLSGAAAGMEIKTMVVIKQGTIINAEDMFEIWNGLNITVCRYEEGGPDEITPLENAVSQVAPPDEELYQNISGLTG